MRGGGAGDDHYHCDADHGNGNGAGNGAVGASSSASKPSAPNTPAVDPRQPNAEERARVAGVVAEADATDYWFLASKDGSRESHYR